MTARWPLLRVLLTSHVSFLFVLWIPAMLVSAAILGGVALWGEVNQSIWHHIATQVPRWVVLGLGVDAITTYLRLNLAHGHTRRDFLRQLWPYLVGMALALAVMITLAYQIERGVFDLIGWDHRTAFPTLFGDTGNIPSMFGAFALMLLLWSLAGAMIAAAFTRTVLLGIVTIPVGLLIVAPSEVLVGLNGVPLFEQLTEPLRFPLLTALGVSVGGAVLGGLVTWGIVRDIPVPAKVA
jgi:hypothetical protein